jgi:Sporulation and spore germination
VIPRYQIVIFSILVLASLAMAGMLWHLRQKAHERLVAGVDSAPTKAPEVAPAERATLMVANDDDNSLLPQVHSLPLPADPGSRARAVLARLLDLYAAPNATHPVPGGGASVSQVFLLPVAGTATRTEPAKTNTVIETDSGAPISGGPAPSHPQMAVVNLTSNFAAGHPSGLETETLTVLSICGTIHANLPQVTEVRFLVDGQQRPSLAGHADLTRTYLVGDASGSIAIAPSAVPTEVAHP